MPSSPEAGADPMEKHAVVWAWTGDVREMAREPVSVTDDGPDEQRSGGLPRLYYWDGQTWRSSPHDALLYGSQEQARRVASRMNLNANIWTRTVVDARGER